MLNQATIDALYSATYIENYLDFVENLPDELQRYVSRVRELDLTFHSFLKEVEQQQRDAQLLGVASSSKKKNYLSKVQQALICAQELGDEKLQILQQVQDIIENKTRQLDLDYRNLADVGKDVELSESAKDTPREGNSAGSGGNNNGGGSTGERQSKRVRRTRTDTATTADLPLPAEIVSTPEPSHQVQQAPQQVTPVSTNTGSTQKKTGSASMGKKKKRKSRQTGQQNQQAGQQAALREERDEEMLIDPDEPVYCLCHQISYGEMIMCDNELCPYEWFHFSCVSLGVKPKGKWFCPKCRGDRSSVMKPKAQFLKELERIKQEKEQKEEKGS